MFKNIFTRVRKFVKGWKSYSVAGAIIANQVAAVLSGDATLAESINWFLLGGGFATLRASMHKSEIEE